MSVGGRGGRGDEEGARTEESWLTPETHASWVSMFAPRTAYGRSVAARAPRDAAEKGAMDAGRASPRKPRWRSEMKKRKMGSERKCWGAGRP